MFPCKRACFAVRTEVLDELTRDPEWNRKLENAKTSVDVARVVAEFCHMKGYKVKEVRL